MSGKLGKQILCEAVHQSKSGDPNVSLSESQGQTVAAQAAGI